MKFFLFKFINNFYRKREFNDKYLDMLADIFDEGWGWTNGVKEMLLDPESTGLIGNKTDIEKINDRIKIAPLYADNPEEYEITINRTILLNLIDKWFEFVERDTPEIYLIRHDDDSIEISDHLPEEKF